MVNLDFNTHTRASLWFFGNLLFRTFINPKVDEQLRFYLQQSWEDKEVYTFPKSWMNILAWLEFEVPYFYVTNQLVRNQ